MLEIYLIFLVQQSDFHPAVGESGIFYGLTTNPIDPIGTPGWASTSWGYHQYGWFSGKVDDACIRANQNNPILPTNMSQDTYDGYLLAPGQYYTGSDVGNASVY